MTENKTPLDVHLEWNEKMVAPHEQRAQEFMGHSISYAQIAVRWAFMLNGGALIAFPGFVTALGNKGTEIDLSWFVAGLASIALCALIAYINFQCLAQMQYNEANKMRWIISGSADEVIKEEQSQIENENERLNGRVALTYGLGILTGCASYLLFCTGCFKALSAFGA
ncbi:hypothetical protein [Rhodospira trueperi]|uniref:hypothetical protein n=1 Tax=Rhodospira trueperi TaxID=69960 RepID=UPI00115F8DED|nr:hypothetical protein [Rhodospira trueperi]